MGSIRFETYYAGSFLVDRLQQSGAIKKMEHDGGDIILFQMRDDTRVSIHLIESAIPLYEIRKTLTENGTRNIHTMFVLWANMMLPEHNQRYIPEDWMQALFTLNKDHIYGYDYFNAEVFVFPVYFRGGSSIRDIEYGTTVKINTIKSSTVETRMPYFTGHWRVTGFDDTLTNNTISAQQPQLAPFFATLGMSPSADLELVKKAYRLLAHRYHPDISTDPNSHEKMQAINEAYQRIQAALKR